MKKLIAILLVGFVLTGCSSAQVKAPSNDALFQIKDRIVTEKEIYNSVVSSESGYQILKAEAQAILLKGLVTEDEAFKKKTDEKLAEAKAYIGKDFELFLKTNGFKDENDYVDKVIKDVVRLDTVVGNAMADDYDKLKDLRPREVRVVEVTADQKAKAQELAKAGVSLEEIAKELKITGTYNGSILLVSDISSLDTAPLDKLLNATETGLIEEAVDSTDKKKAYILEVVNVDAEALKDKAIEQFLLSDTLSSEYLKKVFVKNNFKVYDQKLADAIRKEYPGYLK